MLRKSVLPLSLALFVPLLVLATAGAAHARSDKAQRLFSVDQPAGDDAAGLAAFAGIRVHPDFEGLAGIARLAASGERGQILELNLADGLALEASIETVEFHGEERYILSGTLRGGREGSVILAVERGALAGRVFMADASFLILPDGDGGHAVFAIDQAEREAPRALGPAAAGPEADAPFVNPSADLTLSASSYTNGDTITIESFVIKNPNATSTRVRLKLWLKIPRIGEITLADTDLWGYLSLPADLDLDLGPLRLFKVYSFFPPKGDYEINIRLSTPDKTVVYSEDINAFTVN